MTDEVDYSGAVTPDSTDALAELSRLGTALTQAQANVKELETSLALAKKEVVNLSETQIPELMDEVGLTRFTTREGIPFKVSDQVFASITKAKKAAALAWLDNNGHGQIMKRKVIVEFDREQEDAANELTASLVGDYGDDGVLCDKSVHASTLKAWAREQLEAGADIPLELFGIHVRRIAKIG